MRYGLIVLSMLLWSVNPAMAQLSIGIGLPSVSIGINLPLYPELVRVPGYPVYYAPQVNTNYFFYDGMYWVYQDDNWYASYWYNGPWDLFDPGVVPLFVLRIPVRYYRAPPVYFRGWIADAPPRWGDHWGGAWQQRRSGWDRWDRNSAPVPAPLPIYQRQYTGDRYPRMEQQRTLHVQNYQYQPRDNVVRQHYQQQVVQQPPAPSRPEQRGTPKERPSQDNQRPVTPPPTMQQQGSPAVPSAQPPQRGTEDMQRRDVPRPAQVPQQAPPAAQDQRQQPQQKTDPHEQQRADPREQQKGRSNQERESAPDSKGPSPEDRRGQGQDKGRDKGEERVPDRNK
jgi:hypothetical protein